MPVLEEIAAEPRTGRWESLVASLTSHRRDYGSTFLTEFSVLAAQLLVYKLAAYFMGRAGFSEYALARRTVSLVFPIPLLGLGIGLSRYIGFSNGSGDTHKASRYFGATLWCVGIASLCSFLVINIFKEKFAFFFFGHPSYSYLALPISLLIAGLSLHTITCGYFRGHLAIGKANVLQLINLGLGPVAALGFFRHSLPWTLGVMGAASVCASVLALVFFTPIRSVTSCGIDEAKDLLRYGIQRVPGDFILMALFTLPATFIAHMAGVEKAGFVAFGVSLVSMIGSVFAPIGLVLLPKATFMFAGGEYRQLKAHLKPILQATITISVVVTSCLWFGMQPLVRFFLGADSEQVVPIVRILVLAGVPYSLYLVFRNLVDAYHKDGVTAAILSAGLVAFLGFSLPFQGALNNVTQISLSFLAGICLVAALAFYECRRLLGPTMAGVS